MGAEPLSPLPREPQTPHVWPLYVATFLSTYVFSVANIAAPGIQADMQLHGSTTTLVIGAYAVSFTSGLIICGRLGDAYGRRRLFRIGISAILVTAALTALAPTPGLLILGRLLQGCAAALTTPQILSSIQAVLHGRARSRAISLYAVCAGAGTIGGNVLGGGVISAVPPHLGWRSALMSIAVIAFIAWLGSRHLTESRSPNPEGFDFPGSAIVAATLMCLITGLTSIAAIDPLRPLAAPGAFALTLTLLTAAAVGACLLRLHLRRREAAARPSILPLTVIRVPAVAIGMALAMLFFLMLASYMYNYAILTQEGLGITPLLAGVGLIVNGGAFIAVSLFAGSLQRRFGTRIMVVGACVQAAGFAALAVLAFVQAEPFLLWFQLTALLTGGGQGLMFGPLVSVVMNHVPDSVAGLTGGLIATSQQGGMGVGIATLATLFTVLTHSLPIPLAFAWTTAVTVLVSLAFAVLVTRLDRRG
ncbi:MFS transporter [Brevibacterium album]|uniref:MFS transporter n=1 Tax=Brevibacterium album TaxID=417948 RepID=UPI000406D11F|nr:MFS transporter [Brevibacterium album]